MHRIWNAEFGNGRVVRYDPKSGEVTHIVKVPTPYTTCLCFGGHDLRTMYITDGTPIILGEEGMAALSEEERGHAGAIHTVELPAELRGREEFLFAD